MTQFSRPSGWVQVHPRALIRDDFGGEGTHRIVNLPLGTKSVILSDGEAMLINGLVEPRPYADVIGELADISGMTLVDARRHFECAFVEPFLVEITSARPHATEKEPPKTYPYPQGVGCRPVRTPFSVYMEVTQACNLKCMHCFSARGGVKETLHIDTIVGLFEQMRALKVLHLTISGGEPTLHPHFFEILKLAGESSMAFTILTNATRFGSDTDLLDQTIACYKNQNKAMTLGISLDGTNARSHEKIRRTTGCFDLTRKAIQKLAHEGFNQITLHMTMCNHNYRELESIVRWAVDLGLKEVVPFDLLPFGRGTAAAEYALTFDRQLMLYQTVKALQDRFGDEIVISAPKNCSRILTTLFNRAQHKWTDRPFCSAGVSELAVSADGHMYPCPFIWSDEFNLGNTAKDSLFSAWHNDKIKFFRGGYRISELKKCRDCIFIDGCAGMACRATAIDEGDKYGPGASCLMRIHK